MVTNDRAQAAADLIGLPVYSRDGELLGRVKEIQGSAVKVDAPLRPDYWLGWAYVATAEPNGLTLRVSKERLNDAQVTDPAISGDTFAVSAPAPPLLPDYAPANDAALPDYVPPPPPTGPNGTD